VDSFDLATLSALRYARSMRPTTIRAVHFVIDSVRADKLREKWTRADRGVTLDFIDVSDRRLTRAAAELVEREAADPETHVTVVLPRRSYSALLGRLLHDRTADKIAAVISRIPRSAATIVPYDVGSRVHVLAERQAAKAAAAATAGQPVTSEEAKVAGQHGPAAAPPAGGETPARTTPGGKAPGGKAPGGKPPASVRGMVKGQEAGPANGRRSSRGWPDEDEPAASSDVAPIGLLAAPGRAVVEGRIRVVEIKPVERNSVLSCEISDGTGDLTALFYGRSHIPGLVCSARVRLRGTVGFRADGHPVMINPAYELLFPAV
jgi:hypothetical protein